MDYDFRTNDSDIREILTEFRAHRLYEVYDNDSLKNIGEHLVAIFSSPKWVNPGLFEERNNFISQIKMIPCHPDDHRRIFKGLAEAANPHGVIAYLHMLGSKNRVKLEDGLALMTTEDLIMLVRSRGPSIGRVIHFLARACSPGDPFQLPILWKELVKVIPKEKTSPFKGRFQEAMKTLVERYGMDNLGLGKDHKDHNPWIDTFFETSDFRTLSVASSIIAAQLTNGFMKKQDLLDNCFDDRGRIRLYKEFGLEDSGLNIKKINSSHKEISAKYNIESILSP